MSTYPVFSMSNAGEIPPYLSKRTLVRGEHPKISPTKQKRLLLNVPSHLKIGFVEKTISKNSEVLIKKPLKRKLILAFFFKI